jgi:hypothetical protein
LLRAADFSGLPAHKTVMFTHSLVGFLNGFIPALSEAVVRDCQDMAFVLFFYTSWRRVGKFKPLYNI